MTTPDAPLDCGNSGTSMRLLAGLVAGFDWDTELVGDASLSSRPMDRVAEPLGLMGASIEGQGDRCQPPLLVRGGALHGIDWTSKVASAQVKSAIILAGLSADNPGFGNIIELLERVFQLTRDPPQVV